MEIRQGGVVSHLLADVAIPRMFRAEQVFPREHIAPGEIPSVVERELFREPFRSKIRPGMTVAVTAGSRGIANVDIITRAWWTSSGPGGRPPSSCPPWAATAAPRRGGQLEVLASYGITPDTMGCEIRSSMEVVELGVSSTGMPVYLDKNAYGADGIILSCRLKPHNAFRGPTRAAPAR